MTNQLLETDERRALKAALQALPDELHDLVCERHHQLLVVCGVMPAPTVEYAVELAGVMLAHPEEYPQLRCEALELLYFLTAPRWQLTLSMAGQRAGALALLRLRRRPPGRLYRLAVRFTGIAEPTDRIDLGRTAAAGLSRMRATRARLRPSA